MRAAVFHEPRAARITVVSQGCDGVVDADLRVDGIRNDVVLTELTLPAAIGPAQARHLGVLEGDEDFVGFLDDDIEFARGRLSSLVDRCEHDALGGACGVLVVPEASVVGRFAKGLLFRSIFRDRRQPAVRGRRAVRSAVLSGGMAVYRRSLYLECAPAWTTFVPDAYGEDVELSYSVSRLAPLVVDPSVGVHNGNRRQSLGPQEPTAQALAHLDRYRSFAARHASNRRHWLAYEVVLAAVLARGMARGAGARFALAVVAESARTARRVVAPSRSAGPSAGDTPAAVRVGAIVVYFQSDETIAACVQSLAAQTRPPDTIVVSANSAVAAPLAAQLAALGATVIDNGGNQGFAVACNRAARTLDVDQLWFVNPDVTCAPTCLEHLLRHADIGRRSPPRSSARTAGASLRARPGTT